MQDAPDFCVFCAWHVLWRDCSARDLHSFYTIHYYSTSLRKSQSTATYLFSQRHCATRAVEVPEKLGQEFT